MEKHTPEATATTMTAATSVETPVEVIPSKTHEVIPEEHTITEEHTVNFYPDTLTTVGKFSITNTLITGMFGLVIFLFLEVF